MVTRISIERLVQWAVKDEWPKVRDGRDGPRGSGSGWGATASYVELLTVIDENRFGVVPAMAGAGEPHADAVAVGEALESLAGATLDEIDLDWLIGDIAEMVPEAIGQARRAAAAALDAETVVDAAGRRGSRRALPALVVSAAVLGAPDGRLGRVDRHGVWREDVVRLVGLRHGGNGKEVWRRKVRRAVAWNRDGEATAWTDVEVDVVARDDGSRPVDAYRVVVIKPDPAPVLRARVRHVIWRSALRALAAVLEGRLVAHEIVDDGASALPWLGLGRKAGRVLSGSAGGGDVTAGPMAGRGGRARKIPQRS